MKVHAKLQTIINPRGFLIVLFLLLTFQSARGVTFIVTNAADSGPGSLRQAILLANLNLLNPDLIIFGIKPAGGVKTIILLSELPAITDIVTIDGWTQAGPGLATTPQIELRGNSRLYYGLRFGPAKAPGSSGAHHSFVRGLIINGFFNDGIKIDSTSHVTVQGCYLGTNADGDAAQPNNIGVSLTGAFNCLIGGPNAQDRNVLSGNETAGVLTQKGGDNVIEGNYIGLSASGSAPLGNNFGVLIIQSLGDLVGGPKAGQRNVISGNRIEGILVSNTSKGPRIQGNYIGTTPDGLTVLANSVGIGLADDDYNTIIGGGDPAAGNVISGNKIGINAAKSHGAIIQNNLIGVASDRSTPLGNETGIAVFDGGNMKIGGTTQFQLKFKPAVSAGNIIAFNTVSGVRLRAGEGNLISRNQIHDNAGLGIDLNQDGVTANDKCDADSGPNGLQNFPIISAASSVNGNTTIIGHLNSNANKTYRIEFFSNPSCDPSGNGEGAVYLGSILVAAAPKNCDTGFTVTFNTALPPNTFITATATHPNGSTSEFSPCVSVSAPQ